MKTPLKILLALVGLAVAAALPAARAADETAPAKKDPPKKERAVSRLDQLTQRLNLTDEQKAKVATILQDEEKAIADLRKDKTLTQEARQTKRQEIQQDSQAKIRALLTPEQAAKLDAHGKGRTKAKASTE